MKSLAISGEGEPRGASRQGGRAIAAQDEICRDTRCHTRTLGVSGDLYSLGHDHRLRNLHNARSGLFGLRRIRPSLYL